MADVAEPCDQVMLPRLGAGIYVRLELGSTERVATWDRPEDTDAAMAAAGIEDWHD